jgi:hypothetical protein
MNRAMVTVKSAFRLSSTPANNGHSYKIRCYLPDVHYEKSVTTLSDSALVTPLIGVQVAMSRVAIVASAFINYTINSISFWFVQTAAVLKNNVTPSALAELPDKDTGIWYQYPCSDVIKARLYAAHYPRTDFISWGTVPVRSYFKALQPGSKPLAWAL